MSATSHLKNAANVTKAPGYYTSSGRRNWEPALLWTVIACVAIVTVRTGKLPDGPQAITWVVLAAFVVGAGALAPVPITLALVALLLAGALNVNNKLTSAIDAFTGKISALGIVQTVG
ncbi:MAG TPA: hypothetical protein VGE81_07665 [Candidatus Limnocylindrales bacterium]|jgi:hypothetical protein|nr:hypothetical protein [Chloroflexota bacterium]